MKSIIFADNDKDFLDTRAEFLTRADYLVLKASSFNEAETLLRDSWAPLAILDIRLVNDDDEKDLSGLTLAEAYRTVTKIILTNFPETEIIRRVLRVQSDTTRLAIDLLHKKEGPAALLDAVHQAFTQQVRINWDLIIEWKSHDWFTLVNLIGLGHKDEYFLNKVEEFEHLFRRLFYEKDQIRIDLMLWQRDARIAMLVFAFKNGEAPELHLVVSGGREQINKEAVRFANWNPPALGEVSTVLKDRSETTHFGALNYVLSGTDFESIQSLMHFHNAAPDKVFNTCLSNLFQKTLTNWHQNQRYLEKNKTLTELYRECLRMTNDNISANAFITNFQAIMDQVPTLGIEIRQEKENLIIPYGHQRYAYPDPNSLVFHGFETGRPVIIMKSPGYLSSENILVARDGRTWLTDFGNVGYVPLLWNFVLLESEIRFDWLESGDLQKIFAVERALVSGDFYKPDLSDVDAPLRKPLRAILSIRKLAHRSIDKDFHDYNLGIFFCAAKRIADYDPNKPLLPNELIQLAHALIAMAMIGNLISKKSDDQQKEVAKPLGIVLNQDNHQVWVEGNEVEVASQDFELLSYLYARPNRLCKREELFKHMYGRQYTDSEDYLLNTAISRLREKIEPEKERPIYLITKRGVGYILKLPNSS